jgi:hypothetical protein
MVMYFLFGAIFLDCLLSLFFSSLIAQKTALWDWVSFLLSWQSRNLIFLFPLSSTFG